MAYDIGVEAKMTEFSTILEEYTRTLSQDGMLKLQNDMQARLAEYMTLHIRDIVQTGIVRIGNDMEISATGMVPGTPLNQFSLDEYQGNLRIAVTVGGSGCWAVRRRAQTTCTSLTGASTR